MIIDEHWECRTRRYARIKTMARAKGVEEKPVAVRLVQTDEGTKTSHGLGRKV